jgi:hypothetical protein
MMDTENHIQMLLDRFMAGNSSIDEEKELGTYFSTHDVKSEWQAYQQMFAYFDKGMDDGTTRNEPNTNRIRQMRRRWMIAAAAVVIGVMVTTFTWLKPTVVPQRNAVASRNETTIGAVKTAIDKDSAAEIATDLTGERTCNPVARHQRAAAEKPQKQIDSTELKKIDDEIADCHRQLQMAQTQELESLDDLDNDIRKSDKIIETVYAISFHHNRAKMKSAIAKPSNALNDGTTASTINLVYK